MDSDSPLLLDRGEGQGEESFPFLPSGLWEAPYMRRAAPPAFHLDNRLVLDLDHKNPAHRL
jgi:hypothetical protein